MVYGEEVIAALRVVWAVMDVPAGKRMAPFLAEIVDRLRACKELMISDQVRDLLVSMSAATIDRRLAGDRARLAIKGRSGTKPGSLLKSQVPIRTWADWNDAEPGFVEIDCVGHEGGDPRGDFCQSLDVTDIATGWTEPRAVKNKAQRWVFAALMEISAAFPFPIRGIDSDNGSKFINAHLLRYCNDNKITFTRRGRAACSCSMSPSPRSPSPGHSRWSASWHVSLEEAGGQLRCYDDDHPWLTADYRPTRVTARIEEGRVVEVRGFS